MVRQAPGRNRREAQLVTTHEQCTGTSWDALLVEEAYPGPRIMRIVVRCQLGLPLLAHGHLRSAHRCRHSRTCLLCNSCLPA